MEVHLAVISTFHRGNLKRLAALIYCDPPLERQSAGGRKAKKIKNRLPRIENISRPPNRTDVSLLLLGNRTISLFNNSQVFVSVNRYCLIIVAFACLPNVARDFIFAD